MPAEGTTPLSDAARPAQAQTPDTGWLALNSSRRALLCSTQSAEEAISPVSPVGADEVLDPAANEAIGAILQLFYLCNPGKDVSISRADLESVLHQHLGRREDVASALRLLTHGQGEAPPERFDFLSYWHGMERFFQEAGSWPQPHEQESGDDDMIRGMQRFRDGVLKLWHSQETQGSISSRELLALLGESRDSSQDPDYWAEVMQIVPHEEGFSLTLSDISEAVCVWLRDYLRAEAEAAEEQGCSTAPHSQAASPRFCCLGIEAQARLFTDSRRSPSPTLPGWLAPVRSFRRGSAVSTDTAAPPALAAELQRAHELTEVLLRAVDPENATAQTALSQLASVHESLSRLFHIQEAELGSLRSGNAALEEKQRRLQADAARAHELLEEERDALAQRDEQRKRADALEREVKELKDHNALSYQELDRLRSKSADAERERLDVQRRDWQWRDRCNQLEQAADTAEGQARWMSSEVQRQAARLSTAEANVQLLRQDSVTWRWRSLVQAVVANAPQKEPPVVAPDSLRPRSASVQPAGTGALAVRQATKGGHQRSTDLHTQVRMQRSELQRLRAVRDELLAANENWPTAQEPGDENSPRQVQAQHRCSFLSAQLQALLKHTHEVEQLLDVLHDARCLGSGPSPDVKRRLSIQKVQEEGEAVFNELSERLYTLEIQKADADLELRQLQHRTAEQDRQLCAGQQLHEELLAELGAARQATGGQEACQACHKIEFYVGTDTSATSETRSVASGSGGGVDAGSFLMPFQGTLRTSPKQELTSSVKKVVALHRVVGAVGTRRSEHTTSRGDERSSAGLRPSLRTEEAGRGLL